MMQVLTFLGAIGWAAVAGGAAVLTWQTGNHHALQVACVAAVMTAVNLGFQIPFRGE